MIRMIRHITGLLPVLMMVLILGTGTGSPAAAADTMLMFVGEDLEVLSIASRRQEAAWSAPAVAHVITRKDMEDKNAQTIAQSLEGTPGFHFNETEKGSMVYLRGIPDSALFLFDTVPMGSGVIKSEKMIDYDTSLASVKRIEVIRGPGSVLWGADAFAGVVNVVPKTGRDLQGVETGLMGSTQNYPGEAFLNYGVAGQEWNGFLSISGRKSNSRDDPLNVVAFWHDGITPEPLETRYGTGGSDDSRYVTLYGNAAYDDWLTLSMKISDSRNAYTVSDWQRQYFWEEQTDNTTQMYKMEMSRNLSPDSDIRFTGYYTRLAQDYGLVDRTFDREESSLFGEMIYDQSLFVSHGLLTLGASWRRDRYERIPVWDSFFPDMLQKANEFFLPRVNTIDFDNDLGTLFAQYRHEFEDVEVWTGFRYDDHDQYEDRPSFNAGLAWHPGSYMFKLLYGTGYRTPFARQLKEDLNHKLEKISTLNAQLSWKNPSTQASATAFVNEIDNHVIEDRYAGAGLSMPNRQTIYGLELELGHQFTERFHLGGNLTFLSNSGPNEHYFYNDYSYTDPDGNLVKHYLDLEHDYDMGPDILGNLTAGWQITDHVSLVSELRYFAGQTLYFPIEDATRSCDDAWVMDMHLHVKKWLPFDLSLFVLNVLDQDHDIPGVYSVTDSQGVAAGAVIRVNW
jgi:outer membrane receptor for ferrienterochelin and colicin